VGSQAKNSFLTVKS